MTFKLARPKMVPKNKDNSEGMVILEVMTDGCVVKGKSC